MKKELLCFLFAGMLSTCAFSAEYQLIDFKSLTPKNGEALDASVILDAVSGTDGMVKSVTCKNAIYGKGTNLAGVWFDSPSEGNEGSITLEINPLMYVKATRINVYGSKAKDLIGQAEQTPVSVSVNGVTFTGTYNNKTGAAAVVTQTLENEIVKTITVTFPFAENNPYKEDSGCLQSIRIYYEPVEEDAREQISEWKFSKDSDTAYLDKEYTMPSIIAVPLVAAEMAEYTSSDEDVAYFEEGKVKLRTNGKTTITASVGENLLFRPYNNPASYELTVNSSSDVSTICVEIGENELEKPSEIYNLQGVRVSDCNRSGVYLMRDENGKMQKIVIK